MQIIFEKGLNGLTKEDLTPEFAIHGENCLLDKILDKILVWRYSEMNNDFSCTKCFNSFGEVYRLIFISLIAWLIVFMTGVGFLKASGMLEHKNSRLVGSLELLGGALFLPGWPEVFHLFHEFQYVL